MLKKRNPAVAIILALVLTVALAACQGTATTGTTAGTTAKTTQAATTTAPLKPVTIKIWGGVPAESGPDAACQDFNKAYSSKGITATYERFVNDDAGNLKLDTALLSGIDVDLYVSYSMSRLKKRVDSGMAVDLTDLAKNDGFDFVKNFGEIVKSYYVNEKPYTVPTYAYKYCLLVNKDIFDASNVAIPTEWTIDEFRETCKKLTKGTGADKTYGAFISLDSQKYFPAFVVGTKTGGDYFYKNGADSATDFDNPLYQKVLQSFVDMTFVDKSIVPYSDIVTQKLTAINMFVGGKVVICDAYWIVRDIKNKEKYPHTFKTAFVPMPTAEKMTRDASFVSGGYMDYFSINSKSDNKQQSWEFIKWYSTGGMMPMIPFGRIPAYVGIDKNVVSESFAKGVENLFDMDSFKRELLRAEKKFQIQKITTKLPEITKIAEEEFEMAYIGKKDAATALADAKKRGDEILSKK